MKIYLLRAQETIWQQQGLLVGAASVALSERGRSDADALATFFDRVKLAAVYTSPVEQARDTAERVTRKRYEIRDAALLYEQCFGRLDGQLYAEFLREERRQRALWEGARNDFIIKDGDKDSIAESYEQMRSRVIRNFREIIEQHSNLDELLLVSHNGPITVITNENRFLNIKREAKGLEIVTYEK